MKKLFALAIALSFATTLLAQETDSIRRLTIIDCIDLALQNNIELKNSEIEIEKARATKNEARSAYFPTISAQALGFNAVNPMLSIGIEDIPNAMVRQVLYNLYTQYGAAFGLKKSYSFAQDGVILNAMAIEPIFAGGRIYNGNKLAKLGIEAAEYQAKIKEDEICLQTECLYWQIVSLEEKIATLDMLDRLLDTLNKDLAGAIEAGLALPTDQFKVTIKQNESQLNRKKLEDGITLLKMALGQYIGVDWQTLILSDTLSVETPPVGYYQNPASAVALRNESHLLDLPESGEAEKKDDPGRGTALLDAGRERQLPHRLEQCQTQRHGLCHPSGAYHRLA